MTEEIVFDLDQTQDQHQDFENTAWESRHQQNSKSD